MKFQPLIPAAAIAWAVFAAGPALAQSSKMPSARDTGPAPAEERESAGAILLEDSPVLAQKAQMQQVAARNRPEDVARGVLQATAALQAAEEANRYADGASSVPLVPDTRRLGNGPAKPAPKHPKVKPATP